MKTILLVASGDLRESANLKCWPAQSAMEEKLRAVLDGMGYRLERAHPVKPEGHGFIASQREGMDVFRQIDRDAPLIVAEAVWQYSSHVLCGLCDHRGPILTLANWAGQWPGLVGLLNLNGCLTKAGVAYSTLWSESFDDPFFLDGLRQWLESGQLQHSQSHVRAFDPERVAPPLRKLAHELAQQIQNDKVLLGVFDEGCMGMYNAIIPDELLMPLGVWKERLSQSALYHETRNVAPAEAAACLQWMRDKGMTFHVGGDQATELTEEQLLRQCAMYIAAIRMAERFGCEAIGVQYQQGLKDLLPASDLVEGMLNNADRPPVTGEDGAVIRPGAPIVHFNEVDECAGLDGVLINRLHTALKQPVETTLHDIRWGERDPQSGEFVWVFEISGAAPPAHHEGGWAGSESIRQPPMFFPAGGGTLRGIARPGELVWSRIFVENNALHMDIGRGTVVDLDEAECRRRSELTNPEWPLMNAVLHGVSRDEMMGRHKANHIQVVYANSAEDADQALAAKACLAHELGIKVHLCGESGTAAGPQL